MTTNYKVIESKDAGVYIISDQSARGKSSFVLANDMGDFAEFGSRESAEDYAEEINADDAAYLARAFAGFPALN